MASLREILARVFRAAAVAAEGQRVVPINVQHQLQTNWCWAACSTSASAFYDPKSTWGQCGLVNAELKQKGCCGAGDGADCNQPWYLDRALKRTGNLARKSDGPARFETVRAEIDAGRPVGVRIGWFGGGGHFVMITGYRAAGGAREVDVQDPWTGTSHIAIDTLTNSYKSRGKWTHTYLTRR
jgi:Papain-like cysteine protease AvrRpt2